MPPLSKLASARALSSQTRGQTLSSSLRPKSITFSPAGLMFATFHLGVASVIEQILGDDNQFLNIEITGVSAGSIIAVGLKLESPVRDMLDILYNISDALEKDPAKCVVDALEPLLLREIKEKTGGTAKNNYNDYSRERFQQITKNLKIGVTHRQTLKRQKFSTKRFKGDAHCYVVKFRDPEDLVAACVLSSYVPGTTGPELGIHDKKNRAVARSSERIDEMERLGFIKHSKTDENVTEVESMKRKSRKIRRESYCDGALSQCLPREDSKTLLVCPFVVGHKENEVLCPECRCHEREKRRKWLKLVPNSVRIGKASLKVCDCLIEDLAVSKDKVLRRENVNRIFMEGRKQAMAYFKALPATDKADMNDSFTVSTGSTEDSSSSIDTDGLLHGYDIGDMDDGYDTDGSEGSFMA